MLNKRVFVLALGFMLTAACGPAPQYDILITGGTVVDGTGQPGYRADVGIKGDRIVYVGKKTGQRGVRTIDAEGLVIAPGFIDIHTHCDRGILAQPENKNYILQGVTTVVGGNCGGSPLGISGFFEQAADKGLSTNIAVYIGHNTVRQKVMGMEDRAPTAEELTRMEAYVREAMEDGALGLSTGLGYTPGMFAGIEELIALNRIVGEFNA